MNRETCYAALFARLSEAFPAYFRTRDLVPAANCTRWPALILTATEQLAVQSDEGNAPTNWRLGAVAALYLARPGPNEPFETSIHAAIETLVTALGAQPGEESYGLSYHTTLGELVDRAWVQGSVEIHREPGELRAIVLIPIEMLVLG